MMTSTVAAALALCVVAAGPGKAVDGESLRKLFASHEYGDGVHFAYRFLSNGTFSGTEMGKDVQGTWRMSGSEICWTWKRPPGAEECYVARRNGTEVSLFRNGAEQWYGTLKPITSREK